MTQIAARAAARFPDRDRPREILHFVGQSRKGKIESSADTEIKT